MLNSFDDRFSRRALTAVGYGQPNGSNSLLIHFFAAWYAALVLFDDKGEHYYIHTGCHVDD